VVKQVRSLAGDVEAVVREAMARVLPAELASQDPLVRRSDHADFQSNVALAVAKRAGEKPRDVAEKLRQQLDSVPWLASVELSGPGFLNISLSDGVVLDRLRQRQNLPKLGVAQTQVDEVVVLDYSAPNIAKEMHVGHLRSTLIGDVLARVLSFLGGEVIRQNHVGDWGTQFGMLIQYIVEHSEHSWRRRGIEGQVGVEGQAGGAVSALDALYRAARARFDADPEFKDRSQKRVVALQAGDADTLALWREIVEESEVAFQEVYDRLGVLLTPQDILGESFYNSLLGDVVDELRRKGIVEESEGALCVFFDDILSPEGNRVPLLVRKNDGGFGYGATDLATIRYSIQERKATTLLYVVDSRQAQHFDMIFRTARRAGWLTDDIVAVHVQHGTVMGPDGRPFKTRSGGAFRLVELLDSAQRRAREIVTEKAPHQNDAELDEIAQVVGIGAVKYAELATSRTKDYSFDVDRMVSFTGQTGVYLQYTHARIESILRRAADTAVGVARFSDDLTLDAPERVLALLLDEFGATVQLVATTLEPHRLAGYLYTVAKAFTDFYEACPVLKAGSAEIRANRLALCQLTAEVLSRGLGLLGIAAPERM
jgi:arginyl-tRNA synthetase